MTFRVLHVCTGNICRSPMAEHLMREGLRQRLGERAAAFEISSAGTWGLVGEPVQPYAGAQLTARGIDGSAFRARRLVAELVEGADLVLTATREHRAKAVTLAPRALRRTFTLRELDRLLASVDPSALPTGDLEERARALVAAAVLQKGFHPPERLEDDDVDDPYQGPEAGYAVCADLLARSLTRPLDLLAGR